MASDRRCAICQQRPQQAGSAYCYLCNRQIAGEREEKAERHNGWHEAVKFLHWRGFVVGLFDQGHGRLEPRPVCIEVGRLPKLKVLDLDTYLPGYDREQVAKFKRAIRQCYDGALDGPRRVQEPCRSRAHRA